MIDHRDGMLSRPHMQPLRDLLDAWRAEGLELPNFDPLDGGINAEALFFSESPGPKAVQSSYISRDNNDPSAKNMARSLRLADLSREETLLWNIVPQFVSSATKNERVTIGQIRAAIPRTQQLIDLIPGLQVVVFCGRSAQWAIPCLVLRVPYLCTFHTGAQSYNHLAHRESIERVFRKAKAILVDRGAGSATPDL